MRAEEDAPELVGKDESDRHEEARLVQHHLRRIEAGDLADEREPCMPERERVTGMQTAVAELVDRPQRQPAEVGELANPREVEERVAADDPLDRPECDSEAEARK